jgi:hypothetical protein
MSKILFIVLLIGCGMISANKKVGCNCNIIEDEIQLSCEDQCICNWLPNFEFTYGQSNGDCHIETDLKGIHLHGCTSNNGKADVCNVKIHKKQEEVPEPVPEPIVSEKKEEDKKDQVINLRVESWKERCCKDCVDEMNIMCKTCSHSCMTNCCSNGKLGSDDN